MHEELLLLLGDKIKTKRTHKNITLEQLATKAGVSKGLISQIENIRTVPLLGQSVDSVLQGDIVRQALGLFQERQTLLRRQVLHLLGLLVLPLIVQY